MHNTKRLQLLLAILFVVSSAAAARLGIPRVLAAIEEDLRAKDEAMQSIGSAAAAAVDRSIPDDLANDFLPLMARHTNVLAVELVRKDGRRAAELGAVDQIAKSMELNRSDVRRVTLIRGGQRWGEVRVLFKSAAHASTLHPGNPRFWVITGIAVVVLPVTIAVTGMIRRRLDRSPRGPMAVAAERARHTLDTLAEGVILLDAGALVIFANRTFQEILGRKASGLIHQPIGQLAWTSPNGEAWGELLPWNTAIQNRAPVRGIRIGLRCEDKAAIFIVNCTPLLQKRDSLYGVLVTLDDVTELEQGRLALQEARDAAQHANEAKSRFLAMMSHEIRTPLNGVSGSLQLLKQTDLHDRQTQYVEAARFSASTLLHLINDILDFSKVEAGQLELSLIDFDFRRCVDDTVLMMVQNAAAKGLVVAYEIAPEVAEWFHADPDRIRQIIINLMNNAVKFTERGSVVLRVNVESETADRQRLTCAVIDTGIGISADRKHRLFKAFSQVDSSTSRRYGGTGLGLVISKQLCELMGGSIGVDSIEGQGTTFTFTLELSRALQNSSTPTSLAGASAAFAILVGLQDAEIQTAKQALCLPERAIFQCSSEAELAQFHGPLPSIGTIVAVIGGSNSAGIVRIAQTLRASIGGASLRVVGAVFGQDVPASSESPSVDRWMRRPIGVRRLLAAAFPEEGASDQESMDSAGSMASSRIDLSGLRILLAEDNAVGQMVVGDMLHGAGARCDAVGNGNEVIAAVLREKYDVILMDCFMPELDGFEATKRIRELQRQGKLPDRLPIIALTAKAMRGDRQACLDAGMEGYVTKPVDQDELFRAVAEYTGRTGNQAGGPAIVLESANAAALRQRFGQKPELLSKLLGAFRQASSEDMGRIEEALRTSNARGLEQAAHRLAGGAGFVCADRVRGIAAELERRGADGHLDGLASLNEDLRRELAATFRELEAMSSSLANGQSSPERITKEITQ